MVYNRTMSLHMRNSRPVLQRNVLKNLTSYRKRQSIHLPLAVQLSSVLVQTDENGDLPELRKASSTSVAAQAKLKAQNPLLSQAETVGIMGGVSVFSTLIFLEKLVWMSSREGKKCQLPFVVCSDPELGRKFSSCSSLGLHHTKSEQTEFNHSSIIENFRSKRAFLEQSGAHCIVMPCHVSHAWFGEVFEGCSLPVFHAGECIARELKEANLKPLEAGSNVRIGLLASHTTLAAGFYQEKLQNQGFEVVLPDKATMEHVVIAATESLNRRDMEGARNLLRIAIQVLLVRAVNTVIIAYDEMLGLLPHDDPLLKKCVDPMDALARSTVQWAKSYFLLTNFDNSHTLL